MPIRSPRLVAALALPLLAMAPPDRDWGAALRSDAQALHDDLAANHPGPVNIQDPGFERRNDAQLRLALQRAATAHSFAAYFFALRSYVASFDDGHLDFGVYGDTPSATRWPGFLTRYGTDGGQRVATRADDSPVPLGARLVGCDGRSAEALSRANVGAFLGRWPLLAQRMRFGGGLFADEGNPYVRRPVRCRFDVGGRKREVDLRWRAIDPAELAGKLQAIAPRPPREIGQRSLADGTRWISLGSFDGDPDSPSGKALSALVSGLRADPAGLRSAPAIVLDLRGNGGGSSDWSRQIAEIVWGRPALDRLPADPARVDWRVSEANLAAIGASRESRIAGGALSPEARRWFDTVVDGLAAALRRGEPLWREPAEEAPGGGGSGEATVRRGPSGPVYLVTDYGCASACLDAVDLWRALGAVHVGQTTGADTLYMDVRVRKLPSGLGAIAVPMKVYRGRARGANEPIVPVHAFPGDLADTAALETWIAALPERRR